MNLKPKRDRALEVNITPLIDVVFLLLIFFMITTSFRHDAPIRIDPPTAPTQSKAEQGNVVEVWIDKTGKYYVDKQPIDASMAALREAIKNSAITKVEAPLLICADANVEHEAVVKAMNAATQVGFAKASICTMKSNE